MKIFVPLLLFLISGIAAIAQISINKELFPKPGDTLLLASDNLPERIEVGTPGMKQDWGFINLKAPYAREVVVKSGKQISPYFKPETIVLQLGENDWEYFDVKDDGLYLIGRQQETLLGTEIVSEGYYQPALLEQPASVELGDTWTSSGTLYLPFSLRGVSLKFLSQLPVRPDSLRFRIEVERKNDVDAYGQLTIPGGIFDVLRVKRVETQDISLDAKVGNSEWQDITSMASSLQGLRKRLQKSYHFLSDQAKEAIAVVHTDPNDNPSRVIFKANRKAQAVLRKPSTAGTVYAFPTEAFLYARFEFANLPKGVYTLRLYNLLGVEVFQERYFVEGNRTEKIDVTKFQSGAYLYSLADEKGRIITTKRFYVKRP